MCLRMSILKSSSPNSRIYTDWPIAGLESFSKDKGDGNENVKNLHIYWAKTIALHALHVRCSVLSISLPSSAKQQREIPKIEDLSRT